MDLREAGVRHVGAALVRTPCRRDVAGLRVRRQVEDVPEAAGAHEHGIAGPALELAGLEAAGDDPARHAVHVHEVHHLAAGVHRDASGRDLTHQRAVGAEQQLLARLAARVEGPRHLGSAEGAVVEQPAVLASEGHTLSDALVDDAHAALGQAVDVVLSRAVVAALDGVVEEAPDAVAVVLVVLGGVDAALGGDRVGASGRVLDAEHVHVVAHLGQGGRCRAACEAGAHDQDPELPAVGRVDQGQVEAVAGPGVGQVPAGDLGVEQGVHGGRAHWAPP